jgi:UDP-glucose 4-epimerase
LLYNNVYGLRSTVLRLTNTYGPGMRIKDARQIFVGIWIRRIIEGEPFEVWGGQQRRDFTFVEDAADAFIATAVSASTIGRVLNVGGCEPVRLVEFAEMLVEANGRGSFVVKEFPLERRKFDIGDYFSDDRCFRELTGWRPRIDIRSGLKKSVEFYREHIGRYI